MPQKTSFNTSTKPDSTLRAAVRDPHPLRLLSPQEIQSISDYIRKNHSEKIHMFYTMDLLEPPKQQLWDWENDPNNNDTESPNSPVKRLVKVSLIDTKWAVWEFVVQLSVQHEAKIVALESKQHMPNVQPLIRYEEYLIAEEVARKDPRVLRILREDYKIEGDLNLVCIEPWSNGYNETNEWESKHRIVRCLIWTRVDDEEDNRFAHPVSGINIVVDVLNKKVLEICDYLKKRPPVPLERSNFNPRMREKDMGKDYHVRDTLKPLEITQPEGPSFKVSGNHVDWEGWSFRVGFYPREGLVLHNLKFQNRPVCYRASVVEMSVPYGEPTFKSKGSYRCALDSAEYGLGYCANSLERGCDCLGDIYYFDAQLHDYAGKPYTIKNAICLHEEDTGVLFKHYDWRTDADVTARARDLLINFTCTIGNYLYSMRYSLTQEGQIVLDVHLNGILNTTAIEPFDKEERHGTEVIPGVQATIHQHLFAARLDMCVDGVQNNVTEVNFELEKDERLNHLGNSFFANETRLKTHQEAKRNNCTETSRFWKVYSSHKKNRMGTYTAYDFVPGHNIRIYSKEHSFLFKRCPWLCHHLHVTQYDRDQQYPSGDYGNQSSGTNHPTLHDWVEQDKSLVNEDLVLYHTFGCSHLPRMEEFPLMNRAILRGFRIQPNGFFDYNPAMDVKTIERKPQCCSSNQKKSKL